MANTISAAEGLARTLVVISALKVDPLDTELFDVSHDNYPGIKKSLRGLSIGMAEELLTSLDVAGLLTNRGYSEVSEALQALKVGNDQSLTKVRISVDSNNRQISF